MTELKIDSVLRLKRSIHIREWFEDLGKDYPVGHCAVVIDSIDRGARGLKHFCVLLSENARGLPRHVKWLDENSLFQMFDAVC